MSSQSNSQQLNARSNSNWRPEVITLLTACIIVLLITFGPVVRWPDWTGFGTDQRVSTSVERINGQVTRETTTTQEQPGRSLWDWMSLLIIPGTLAFVGIYYNRTEKRLEQHLANERAEHDHAIAKSQREDTTLQAYLDQMAVLLLDNLESGVNQTKRQAMQNIARVRTLTAIRRLDTERRNILLEFLRDARLVSTEAESSFVDFRHANLAGVDLSRTNLRLLSFHGADLRKAKLRSSNLVMTQLQGANLKWANLQQANLTTAQLQNAILWKAQLQNAVLVNSQLQNAVLREAHLENADLRGAQLQGVNFDMACLDNADLRGSTITQEQLQVAKSHLGAKLND